MTTKNLPWFIVAFLLLVIVLLRSCTGVDKNCQTIEPKLHIKVDTIFVIDTIIREIKISITKPADSVYVYQTSPIDTVKVLQRYFTKYFYSNVVEDSNIRAVISDTVFMNKITYQSFNYQLKRPQIIIEKEITKTIKEPNKAKVLVGFEMGGSKTGFTNLSPRITYLSKNDKSYSVRVNPFDQSLHVGMDFKIRLRK